MSSKVARKIDACHVGSTASDKDITVAINAVIIAVHSE